MNTNGHDYYTAVVRSMITHNAEQYLNPINTNTGVNFTEKNLLPYTFSNTTVKKIEISTRAGEIHIKKSDDANLIVIMCKGEKDEKPKLLDRTITLNTHNSNIVVCLPSSNNTNSIPELDLYTCKGDIKTDGTYRIQSKASLTIQREGNIDVAVDKQYVTIAEADTEYGGSVTDNSPSVEHCANNKKVFLGTMKGNINIK